MAPVSLNVTDDGRTLRDLAFRLIEPPHDRQRWNAIVHEYDIDHHFHRAWWIDGPTAYYNNLMEADYRSTRLRNVAII